MILILKAQKPIQSRIAEAKDIAFIQTWLPVDLASATSSDRTPTLQPWTGMTLPGSNVVTLTGADGNSISYRYESSGVEWVLARYEVRDGQMQRIVVAHELPAPPVGWTPDQPPTHAQSLRPQPGLGTACRVGPDRRVQVRTGYSTGGSGLAVGDALPADYSGGIVVPTKPRTRCGGTIALILHVRLRAGPGRRCGAEHAAVGFISAFTGTPSRLTIVGFDRAAYQMYPASEYGSYVSLLNPSAEVTAAKNRILQIGPKTGPTPRSIRSAPARTGKTACGGPSAPMRRLVLPIVPDVVVFLTDGDPNRDRTSSISDSSYQLIDLTRRRSAQPASAGAPERG